MNALNALIFIMLSVAAFIMIVAYMRAWTKHTQKSIRAGYNLPRTGLMSDIHLKKKISAPYYLLLGFSEITLLRSSVLGILVCGVFVVLGIKQQAEYHTQTSYKLSENKKAIVEVREVVTSNTTRICALEKLLNTDKGC